MYVRFSAVYARSLERDSEPSTN